MISRKPESTQKVAEYWVATQSQTVARREENQLGGDANQPNGDVKSAQRRRKVSPTATLSQPNGKSKLASSSSQIIGATNSGKAHGKFSRDSKQVSRPTIPFQFLLARFVYSIPPNDSPQQNLTLSQFSIHFGAAQTPSSRAIPDNFIASKLLLSARQARFLSLLNGVVKFVQMPWIMDDFAASLPDHVRKNLMSRLCRLAAREPLEAAEAYLNLRPYKERADAGFAYVHLRANWEVLDNAADVPDGEELDWVDLKVGEAGDMDVRRDYYERDCEDEPILWAYCYQTSYPKLIERLTHLTLRAMGAQRVPYPCHGCAVRHREHFSEAKSGGLEIVAVIIEYWMRRIGEVPIRVPLYA
ncbi:hypothetical protein B0H13DRAFT_1879880 [Mycena leptocephala]|nr:hypothetical protein B0H13DRAFT_1879880 [Mycena leptocephala]